MASLASSCGAWHGKEYGDLEVDCHGGLTYSAPCSDGGHVCHVPQPGESDAVHWLGFDCGHAFDLSPALRGALEAMAKKHAFKLQRGTEEYRTLAYVRTEVESLAAQAHEAEDAARRDATVLNATVHILAYGRSLCEMPGVPGTWPEGHLWVSSFDKDYSKVASCPVCLQRKAEALP